MQSPDLWVPWKGWNFSQSWSGVRDQIPSLPQHQGRQAGALPCQSHCATSLPFLFPGPSGLPEVPQQHPGDRGPVGEWGRAGVCASQGLWRWVLRNREGEALPEITFCLCSLGMMVVSVLEPQGGHRIAGSCGICWLCSRRSGFPMSPLVSLQGHLHDRYGQLVSIYTRLLLTKISFHVKVRPSAPSAPP